MTGEKWGGCLCGAVRFRAAQVKTEFGGCHCKMCQRWTGGPLLAASVPADAIEWSGAEAVGIYQSSDWAERAFCTRCGSGLWYRVTTRPDTDYEVLLGLFDDPGGMRMTSEIFIDAKPGAYAFTGEHRRETGAEVQARYDLKRAEST
ncbi:GFA family protein [Rhodobacteraceae bacterium MCCB 386]|nr:GFA family protein [Roseitranquillus sediminis]